MPMIYWVHGALHLYRLRSGAIIKRTHRLGRNLLDLLGTPYRGVEMPLFIAEGTARQKMRAIRSSDYLSHAYATLAESVGNLVIFGQSLSSSDSHLVDAINENPRRHIAYGVHEQRTLLRNKICAEVEAAFPSSTLHFFDSRSHPLGV
jgi:hypothetical protein